MTRTLSVIAGAVAGGALAVALTLAAQSILPARYEATVLLFAEDARDDADAVRATLAAILEHPGFLPRVVDNASVPAPIAAELARSIRVEPAQKSPTLTQLVAASHRPQELSRALDAVALALVDTQRKSRSRERLARLDQLERLEASLQDVRLEANSRLQGTNLPSWARSAALVLAVLDAQRYGLLLRDQLGLAGDAVTEPSRADVEARLKQLEMSVGGQPPVTADVLDAARQLAAIDGKRVQLLAAREALQSSQYGDRDLRIVRGAESRSLGPTGRLLGSAAFVGALVGVLLVFGLRVGKSAAVVQRDGPMLEAGLNVRVIGAVPRAVTDYGERKLRPLAQTHPEHLAIDGLRSVRTALRVLTGLHRQPGPVVMTNVDGTQNAGHILANLAMLDAQSGYRVLLVETQQSDSVLSALFTTGTRTTLSITMDAAELDGSPGDLNGTGRIRFVVAADEDNDGPPVPGAFIGYFDRVYIQADSVVRAAALLQIYENGTGVLVGSNHLSLREWREARDRWRNASDTLQALIQCGHRIDERSYVAGTNG